jgi:hypothetical protein
VSAKGLDQGERKVCSVQASPDTQPNKQSSGAEMQRERARERERERARARERERARGPYPAMAPKHGVAGVAGVVAAYTQSSVLRNTETASAATHQSVSYLKCVS